MIAARTSGGPAYPEMIEEMDKEINNVIEDFDRAVYGEALRLANETSKPLFSYSVDSRSSGVWRRSSRTRTSRARASRASGARAKRARKNGATRARAIGARARRSRAFIQASNACQDGLSSRIPLYGRHSQIPSQSNHGLGSQCLGSRERSPKECVLVLRLTWNWKNVVSPFDLRNPSRAKLPCWSVFLPEGRPEFERTHKHPSDFHPQTRHTLPPFSDHCSRTPSQGPEAYSRVDERLSSP